MRRTSRVFRRRALLLTVTLVVVGSMIASTGCEWLRELENTPVAIGSSPERPGPTLTQKQAFDDFHYLFSTLKDYYPYLALKKRTEGYDWLPHEREFEDLVRRAKNNEDFAKAMSRIVFSLNNGHTAIVSGGILKTYAQSPEWKDVAAAASVETADYWYALANKTAPSTNWTPFIASCIGSKYVVTEVAPDPKIASKVSPGCIVTEVNGVPVDEYVASHRGNWWLPYDPELRKLWEMPRLRFPSPFTWSSAEFTDL